MPIIPISQRLKNFLGFTEEDSDQEINKYLRDLLKEVCKPCWELKYCPYGPLVEDFPLPPLTKKEHDKHLEYQKRCLESGFSGEGDNRRPLTDDLRKMFEKDVQSGCPQYVVEKVSDFEKEASCNEFGHLCPAFFVSEAITETKDYRRLTRNISKATIVRVVRRGNNTCQLCGKILLDREIEIDHIIPFSKGGHSDESNLRVTCFECNRKRSNKLDFLHY